MAYTIDELSDLTAKTVLNQSFALVRHRVIHLLIDHAIEQLVEGARRLIIEMATNNPCGCP